jgi:hypothetical protein
MRYCYDLEFIEHRVRTWPTGRPVYTVEPISIGIAADDGREYYAVNRDMPIRAIRRHRWLMDNVVPHLPRPHGDRRNHMPQSWLFDYTSPLVKRKERIADEVREFLLGDDPDELPHIDLWAWYGAYDHVSLAWLWGPMITLPEGIPMWTNDLRQECARLGLSPKDLPQQPDGVHDALADARHNRTRLHFLDRINADLRPSFTPHSTEEA